MDQKKGSASHSDGLELHEPSVPREEVAAAPREGVRCRTWGSSKCRMG